MNIAIIGAGALGSVIGFHLAAVSNVTLIDPWAEHVHAINSGGLRCLIDHEERVVPLSATTDPSGVEPVEVALITVKAAQTAWAAEIAAHVLTPDGVAYTLQNGLGNAEILNARLGKQHVGQAVTTLGATLLGPGYVRLAGRGPTTFGATPTLHLAYAIADKFRASGLPAAVSTDLIGLVWGKLIVNVGINALTAILRVPNGALATTPTARNLVRKVVEEAVAVAQAAGVTLSLTDPVAETLAVAQATAVNYSSMLQDVLRGAPTEIDTINGAIVREGARLGVPTPCNAMLCELVAALEETAPLRVQA
ncbi:MAG: 2-dehydropantoate 2-reductase [Chloroflexus sp.]|uniref:ketopantoate reductase family protein n=1 Tax=Chloroflexus sp. TaxID=1904827 RepID=UPI0021DE2076|nr:2-dehydropantoate 2-reductase [Chloroflexus sp.]GIV90296.1 MAG: 2-dehydropantoate 2-reductase [Chloroflexus sp.]